MSVTVRVPTDTVGAFVGRPAVLAAGAPAGPLAGLSLAVKDLVDVAGTVTGAGNPDFAAGRAPAERHAPVVERLLAVQGELESFRRFQDQPAQRAREGHAQLRRFMGTRARRKIRYGALLTNALDLRCVPRALDAVLAHARH